MIHDDLPPLTDLPPWDVPDRLCQLGQPRGKVFAEFIAKCSPDPDTRTAVITCLVLGFWQLKGRALTNDVPSLLLVNAGGEPDDPVDGFTRGLVYSEEENRPRVQTDGPFVHAPIDLAPKAMRNALVERQSLGAVNVDDPHKRQRAGELEERFRAAQTAGYGHGRCRPYSGAWHEEHGLLTGGDDQIILRLNGAPDRAAFRKDVVDNPTRLSFPIGVGNALLPAAKSISLSGSLPAELCSAKVVSHTVALGLPFFLLPHTAETPLAADPLPAVENLAKIWQHDPVIPVSPTLRLPPSAAACEASLRRHLARLPATYEFAVLQAVHQLDGVCGRIAHFAGGGGTGMEELATIFGDLYHQTLRGLAISVAGLSYFGRGLDFDKATVKLLRHLRERGATRCSALLGSLHLKKGQRDAILERLGDEGLVRVEGGVATATPLVAFTRGLYAREGFSAASAQRTDG